jgi:small-conductance mechanosensitive channel
MRRRQWLVASGLVVLVVLAVIGLWLTDTSGPPAPNRKLTGAKEKEQTTLVDQRPLQTARKLAPLASTAEEQSIVQEALRLADHEVDLAFADALREAQEHPAQPTPETRELYKRVSRAQAAVRSDQDQVQSLTKSLASAGESNKEKVQQGLDLAQAQLAMDQDELDDAKEDLTRAGGDPQTKIQRLLDEHETTQHAGDTHAPAAGFDTRYQAGNLSAQLRAWSALREKQGMLSAARQEAVRAATDLGGKHQALEQHVKGEASERQAVAQQAGGALSDQQGATASSRQSAAAAISSLHHFSSDAKELSDLDKRIEDEQGLGDAYGSWITLVEFHRQTALHGIIQSALWILLIVLGVYLLNRLIERYFLGLTPEKKRLHTLQVVVRFALQALGVLMILFVIFGAPNQAPTVLGLAGAGLTVAMKDFIVAFFGWFVLMGRNGIRVGDWVEINGVGGEVVEIGLLRTVLLETGNWTDSGHPTGRKVAFVNSYAVEGHYFNFSTSGQWLWDEIRLLIPVGQNPYPTIDAIQELVTAETDANTRLAEQEWQRTANRYRVKSFSAVPSINVRPTTSGIELVVRYITRAHERYDVRARLYQAVVDLLQRKPVQAAAAGQPSATSD